MQIPTAIKKFVALPFAAACSSGNEMASEILFLGRGENGASRLDLLDLTSLRFKHRDHRRSTASDCLYTTCNHHKVLANGNILVFARLVEGHSELDYILEISRNDSRPERTREDPNQSEVIVIKRRKLVD